MKWCCGSHENIPHIPPNYRESNWPRVPAAALWNPSPDLHQSDTSLELLLQGLSTAEILRQMCSWEMWDSSDEWLHSQTPHWLCWTFLRTSLEAWMNVYRLRWLIDNTSFLTAWCIYTQIDQSQPRLTELPSCSLRHTSNDCWFLYAAEALCYLLQSIVLLLDNCEVSDSYSLRVLSENSISS